MLKYFVKRAVLAVVTIWIVATLTFFLMFLVPGGPFLAEKAPSPATLAALEAKYGLDQPVHIQYKNYMLRLLQGDLGTSLKQRAVRLMILCHQTSCFRKSGRNGHCGSCGFGVFLVPLRL